MYPYNYNMSRYPNYIQGNPTNDRLIGFGGFAVPFLLGGLTGAALSNRPSYYYYQPYPYYYGYPYFY